MGAEKKKRAKESHPVLRCCPVNVAPPHSRLTCLYSACRLLADCSPFFLVRCLAPRRKPVSYVPLLPIFVAIAWVWRHAAFGWLASCVVRSVDLLPYLCAHSRCQVVPCLLGSTMLLRLRAYPCKALWFQLPVASPPMISCFCSFSPRAPLFSFSSPPLLLCFVRAEAGFEDSPFTRTGLGPRLAVVGVGGWFGRVFRLGLKSN